MTYTKKEYYLQYIYLAFRSPFSSYYIKIFSSPASLFYLTYDFVFMADLD